MAGNSQFPAVLLGQSYSDRRHEIIRLRLVDEWCIEARQMKAYTTMISFYTFLYRNVNNLSLYASIAAKVRGFNVTKIYKFI